MQSPHFRHSRRKGRDENYTVSTIINQSAYNVCVFSEVYGGGGGGGDAYCKNSARI